MHIKGLDEDTEDIQMNSQVVEKPEEKWYLLQGDGFFCSAWKNLMCYVKIYSIV
jgi:hypothetical protein